MVSIGRLPQKAPVVDPVVTGATKTDRQVMPWENDPIVEDNNASAPWESDPIVEPAAKKLNPEDIDPSMEAPPLVRAQVGALDKPEDRLTALRKSYPDAQPLDDDNFIMSDPKTGKTMIYNQPGWIPSLGDFASIAPEIGEGVGAVGGAVGGGIAGGTSGSIIPLAGTAAGTVTGGMLGAGLGATAGREATQRGLNYLFGNEDTRTAGEQVWDATKTGLINAAGEGVGVVAAPIIRGGARAVKNTFGTGGRNILVGTADDAALAGERATDLRAIGAEPSAGMVAGNPNTAIREQALAATRAGKPIQDRIEGAFSAMDNEANRIVNGLTPQTMTRQELGQALKDQAAALKTASKARNDYLYEEAGRSIGDGPATGANTRQFLDGLQAERAGMTKSAALNNGKALDDVITQAKAVVDDLGAGINFNQLKEARTNIGKIANDPSMNQATRDYASGLYTAMGKDMGETAEAIGGNALQDWKKANNRFRRTNDPNSAFGTKNTLDPILRAQTPEQAADWVLAQVNKGGTRINAVRRQIERSEGGPELWNTLTGSTVERMGIDASGEFNPTTMLRNWAKMSDEAKSALFSGTARAQYRQDLDRLARIAENMKGYRRLDNHSGTNKAANALEELNLADGKSLLGAVLGGPKALLGIAAGKAGRFGLNRWQAKLLTSPETVNLLARLPQAQMQKGGTRAYLEQLSKLAASTSDTALAVAINDFQREIGYSE
ncbi:hypothetical protein [Rhizobium sp. L43]|uniref:hypothetical protein n=1 Tax=Rhizobium sp. L43 TaxID=2035452 RepID=UPI000BE85F32|nr:hypothetical protein [Rhizobium sp. L43]PDS75431.1 hypothetical protein CO667_26475 [Rhizobium sp. L43]